MIRLLALVLLAALGLAANEAPTLTLPATVTITEDQGRATIVPITDLGPGAGDSEQVILLASELGTELKLGWSSAMDPRTRTGQLVLWPLPDASGGTTVVVSAMEWRTDGITPLITSRLLTVMIAPVNDLPALTVNRPLAVGAGGTATYTAAELTITDADLPDAAALAYALATPPAHGELLLDGAVLGAGSGFTQADIAVGRLAYRNRDGASDQYTVTISDGVVAIPLGPLAVGVTVAGKGRPWLALAASDLSWSEGDLAFLVAAGGRVEDGDSTTLAGGSLSVGWVGGQAAGDRLDLLHQGVGAGQLAVTGAELAYGGRAIGSWSGGTAGQPLVVAFSGPDASPAAAQAVLRALRFANQGGDPGLRTLTLAVVVDDGDAGASLPAVLRITTNPVNDPPRPVAQVIGTMVGVARTARLAASDPDSAVLAWTLGAPHPQLAATLLDPASGLVRLDPQPGWSGSATVAFTVSDGSAAAVAATVAVVVTGPDQPRPLPAGEAPALLTAGETMAVEIDWDCADLPAAGDLAFAAGADAPAGLTVSALGPRRMRVAWTVPAAQPAGTVRFSVIASDPLSGASGCWPALIAIRARPGAVN